MSSRFQVSLSHVSGCFPCKVCTRCKQQLEGNSSHKPLPSFCHSTPCLDILAAHQVSEAQALAVGACQRIQHTPHMSPANHAHNILRACTNSAKSTAPPTEDLKGSLLDIRAPFACMSQQQLVWAS
ncbi:hypothetical protein CVIRNUC_005708 [Coccomyxa viridis]|uniref:Uncharacterized protein n=1 Tax=Coccomyxa viridis TaxID=1274662 RepID=A0AAV1I5S4_9CHLO|nr:hypothetical protein CVIRNUC_005708 [Coccomyxa viridis]